MFVKEKYEKFHQPIKSDILVSPKWHASTDKKRANRQRNGSPGSPSVCLPGKKQIHVCMYHV